MGPFGALALAVYAVLAFGATGFDVPLLDQGAALGQHWVDVTTPGALLASLVLNTNRWKERLK